MIDSAPPIAINRSRLAGAYGATASAISVDAKHTRNTGVLKDVGNFRRMQFEVDRHRYQTRMPDAVQSLEKLIGFSSQLQRDRRLSWQTVLAERWQCELHDRLIACSSGQYGRHRDRITLRIALCATFKPKGQVHFRDVLDIWRLWLGLR